MSVLTLIGKTHCTEHCDGDGTLTNHSQYDLIWSLLIQHKYQDWNCIFTLLGKNLQLKHYKAFDFNLVDQYFLA